MLEAPAIRLDSVNQYHLVRAAYGGGFLGIAAMFVAGAFADEFRRGSLPGVLTVLGGFAVGRVYGIAVDGVPAPLFVGVLAAELVFACLAAACLRRG